MSYPYDKTIVCLANSRKISGRCVAGKIVEGEGKGTWLRPVSARSAGELSESDRRYKNGTTSQLGDVILIPLRAKQPHAFQPENHLIDDGYYWGFQQRVTWSQIKTLLDNVAGDLWENASSGYNGTNDRILESHAADIVKKFGGSLALVEVFDLRAQVSVEGAAFGNAKRKVRGSFSHNGAQYLLSITDPLIERKYLALGDGIYDIEHAIVCLSLSEPFNDYVYKLIAAVFVPEKT